MIPPMKPDSAPATYDLFMVGLSSNGVFVAHTVIQSDAFVDLPSVTVLRITSELHDWPLLRVTVAPNAENGLRKPSQIMIDKAATVPRAKIGPSIGRLEEVCLRLVERALLAFLDLQGSAARTV
jgi:mRNA interferase MazF